MKPHRIRIRLASSVSIKNMVPCFAAALAAMVQIVSSENLRAQTLTPQLTDQAPPPDPIFLQQGTPVIPPSSPDAPMVNDGITVVTYAPNEDVTGGNDEGKADVLPGLAPDQIVNVTVQFGVQKAGQLIQAAALDGGGLNVPGGGLTADENGNVSFTFQAGHDPGLYQVALRDATHEMGVQFWVVNSQAPAENPPIDVPGQ